MAFAQVEIGADMLTQQRIGFQAVSLTHYDDTAEPAIASGSVVEIGGGLYLAAGNQPISGWGAIAANSDAWIKLTVSGLNVSASFTTTPPSWDTAKQGWYSGAERYLFVLRKDASGNYTQKALLAPAPERRLQGPFVFRGGLAIPFIHVQDQKPSGTAAGSFAADAWRTRDLNTVLTNTIPDASLASNQITLPAGTYYVEASAPAALTVDQHKVKLRRITAPASDLLIGTSEFDPQRAWVVGQFVADMTIAIELQHRCSTAGAAFGIPAGFGVVEVYADVRIWKVA